MHLRIVDRGVGISRVGSRPGRPCRSNDSATCPIGDGVGLGLSIAQGFVEAMGGAVRRLDDTPGGGLTVTIVLPRATEVQPDSAGAGIAIRRSDDRVTTVLVVDDERQIRRALSSTSVPADIVVVEAATGEAALAEVAAVAARHRPARPRPARA